jgi:hypothetical protein
MTTRSKAARSGSGPPVFDDADVQKIADLFLSKHQSETTLSDEELADLARDTGVQYSFGATTAWRLEFARRVQRRVEFSRMAQRRAKTSN